MKQKEQERQRLAQIVPPPLAETAEDSDEDILGRSMTQEVDYSDIKSASRQIKNENQKSIIEAKKRRAERDFQRSFDKNS